MKNEYIELARLVATALCTLTLAGSAIGGGQVFAALLNAYSRNPSLRNQLISLGLICFAMIESVGLLGFSYGLSL